MSPAHARARTDSETGETAPPEETAPVDQPAPADRHEQGRAPVATPAAAGIALVLALLLVAAGVVGIRDALVAAGVLDGSSFTAAAARSVDGAESRTWMVPVGVALVLLGLWLVLRSLRPRRRTEIEVRSDVAVWLRPADVARLATFAAEDVSGVVKASSTATRRKVTVTVESTSTDPAQVSDAVRAEVETRLGQLASAPTVNVRSRTKGAQS